MSLITITAITILLFTVIIEGIIIWALNSFIDTRLSHKDDVDKFRTAAWKQVQKVKEESNKWKSMYEKERRQSEHKSRKIESFYRGIIRKQ